ncbi:bifunctional DNA-formamidopyrimidine glycosylase/DNA-(apurinic or apyrimidinic site) lyase [Sphingomicrobium clamense]|uniref:Formamidopyrimidine-DNA glycosylase n=1 Tax=Sphingomicrobium clamense TaxID=2851013 RepID=A0ABS6V5M7_9SPHN|nr:bifunctional DNA-formamidopyrimidine glycosylase/DNA-(apurinic or apyrimidinic site) lyase [Sphingomicrobium sp. B8]
MPELPEVETTVRGLSRVLEGQRIDSVEVRRSDLRRPFPDGLGQVLTGATVMRLGRRAKFGIIETDRGDAVIFHLGMSGRWRIDPEEIGKHDHLVLTSGDRVLSLNDPRRFGSVDLVRNDALAEFEPFVGLGPEPVAGEVSGKQLRKALAGRKAAIKLLLLDQRVIAGLGNIYVCEALWRSKIHPKRAGGRISLERLDRLAGDIVDVIAEAIEAGGSSLRDFAAPDGELGYFAKRFDVYGREGEDCRRCDGTIRRIVQGARSTFFCPSCQT